MNKTLMIEYQGRVDENGKALGHGPKVLNDYFNIIKEYGQVSVFAPREVLREFAGVNEACETKVLPNHIVMEQNTSVYMKIKNKLNMFNNISLALKNSDADTIWFFNVEYYFFLYIFLHRRIKRKIIVTMFLDGYRGGIAAKIKQYVFNKAQKKIDLIISTGKKLEFKNCEYRFVPDYYYDRTKLGKYENVTKERLAVCLGTMGKGKQLVEMVKQFNSIDYPLLIAGRFYDKNLVEELKDMASDNITIRDEYLSIDEYMNILAKATFTVLPYSPDKYDRQTSGVMQEAIFLDTIPVSYKKVLDGNDVNGIGFETWEELRLDRISNDEIEGIRSSFKAQREGIYSEDSVKEFYKKVLNEAN